MHVEQFVMAYKVEQDRIRAILPDGYSSLRPVMQDQYRNTAVGKQRICICGV